MIEFRFSTIRVEENAEQEGFVIPENKMHPHYNRTCRDNIIDDPAIVSDVDVAFAHVKLEQVIILDKGVSSPALISDNAICEAYALPMSRSSTKETIYETASAIRSALDWPALGSVFVQGSFCGHLILMKLPISWLI